MTLYNYIIKEIVKPINLILILGLLVMTISLIMGKIIVTAAIIALPIIFICLIISLRYPAFLFYVIFILNYYIIGLNRYIEASGISYLMDALMGLTLINLIIHTSLYKTYDWSSLKKNPLFIGMSIWMIYCILELVNPTANIQAWITNRSLAINGFIITLVSTVLLCKRKHLFTLMNIYSILALTAIIKVLIQRYYGWDSYEQRWLNNGGALTHIIMTGTRYFSFFSDAGNFGSNMGASGVIFCIAAIYIRSVKLKLYYIVIGILSFYAMFLSGTRGAMIVPLGGLALYAVLCKNVKLLISCTLILISIYIFFAFTNIGQDNQQIRRMRTAFNASNDASFNVRKDNKKKLAEYLKNKPFGEGIGLSGVENQKFSVRFTTLIPHDSTYVKIWVETGIIGVTIYLGLIFGTIAFCSYILMFKIKDDEIRGLLSAYLCGITGLILSAYGNAFWGQYPTNIIAFVGFSMILNAKKFTQLSCNDDSETLSICNKE